MSDNKKKPTALIILDGWGYREAPDDNAIANANTPVWDSLWSSAPHTLISSSGLDVGLPEGQMGNSEVGHMSLGSGRVVFQSITRIDQAIADGSFNTNKAFAGAIDAANGTGGAVHIIGLLSAGGVHSHEQQIEAAIRLAAKRGANRVYLHAFLDGRDTPPRSASGSLHKFTALFESLGSGRIASIVGRYYAMDRDNRWERIETAYRLLTQARADYCFDNAERALEAAYNRDENDEFVLPTSLRAPGEEAAVVSDGDAVLFLNFRADRARQLTHALVDKKFSHFQRDVVPQLADFVMTTQYAADIHASCAFPPIPMENVLGEYLSGLGKTQLRIAETEKYAHITYFFNGRNKKPHKNEKHILIESRKDIDTHDKAPKMRAKEIADAAINEIKKGTNFVVLNFANADMVGHTANFPKIVKAVEESDHQLKRVVDEITKNNGVAIISSDHGNAELNFDEKNNSKHTAHTTNPVPLILTIKDKKLNKGALRDIAPTILELFGVKKPKKMTGKSLIEK